MYMCKCKSYATATYLLQTLNENEAIQTVADGFSDLIEDFKDLLYLGDNYTVSMQNVKTGMENAATGFERLKRAYD